MWRASTICTWKTKMHHKGYTTGTFSLKELQHAREGLGPFILIQVSAVLSSAFWWHTISPELGQASHWAGGRPSCRYNNLVSSCLCLCGHFNHNREAGIYLCCQSPCAALPTPFTGQPPTLEQSEVWQWHWWPWGQQPSLKNCLLFLPVPPIPVVLTIPIRWHSNCSRGLEGGLRCSHQSCVSTNKYNQAQYLCTL